MRKSSEVMIIMIVALVFTLMTISMPVKAGEGQKITAEAIVEKLGLPADGYTDLQGPYEHARCVMSPQDFFDESSEEWQQNGAIPCTHYEIRSQSDNADLKLTIEEINSVAEAKKHFKANFDVNSIKEANKENKKSARQRLNKFLDDFYREDGRKKSDFIGSWGTKNQSSPCYNNLNSASRPEVGEKPPNKAKYDEGWFDKYQPTTSRDYYSAASQSFVYQYLVNTRVRVETEDCMCVVLKKPGEEEYYEGGTYKDGCPEGENARDPRCTSETCYDYYRDSWVEPSTPVQATGTYNDEYHFYRIANCIVTASWTNLYGPGGKRNPYTDEWPQIQSTLEEMAGVKVTTSEEKGITINLQAEAKNHQAKETSLTIDYQPSTITVSGTVTNKKGEPIEGAKVSSSKLGKSAKTDSRGRYQLQGNLGGEQEVSRQMDFRLEKFAQAKITIDAKKNIIPIPGKLPLTITAVDQTGKPLGDCVIDISVVDKNGDDIPWVSVKQDERRGSFLNENGKNQPTLQVTEPKGLSRPTYLRDWPLKSSIRAKITKPDIQATLGQKEEILPFNLALVHGVTVENKNLKPVAQHAAPDVEGIPKTMVFDKEYNTKGDFWVIVKPHHFSSGRTIVNY